MLYITLGNLTRFLTKLKDYLDNKYLKLTGGTVTGDTIFKKKISAHEVCLTGLSDVSLVNKDNGSIAKDGLTILDEGNYNLFTPTLHGTGATGTWDINISGNALNDSEGNKIVDTYAKKSEVETYTKTEVDNKLSTYASFVEPYDTPSEKDAVQGYFLFTTQNAPFRLPYTQVAGMFGSQFDNRYVAKTEYAKLVLSNGHLSINGSELWIE